MLLCKMKETTNELCFTEVSDVLSWFVVQALSDVPTESGKTFKALLPCLFISFFFTFSIFIADVGRGSRPGEAAFRSVLIPTDGRLQIGPVFIFLDGGQQNSSYSTAALEFEQEHQIAAVYESPRMSRRSLRLQTGAGHYASENVADFSLGQSTTRRETRTLRSKKQQSSSGGLSLSLSQAATPRKTLSFSAVNTPVSSGIVEESSAVTDAALLTGLEQSRLRQRTVTTTNTFSCVDGHSGRRICSDHRSGVNGDTGTSKSHSIANGYICKECSFHSQKIDSFVASSPQLGRASSDILSSSSSSPFTSIYSRDRSQRKKTGVLRSICNTCVRYSKQSLAPFVSLLTVIFSSVVWLGSQARASTGKGVLAAFTTSMRQAMSSSLVQLHRFKESTLHWFMGDRSGDYEERVASHSSFCGSINVKGLMTEDAAHLKLNGSLCDDCKGKQHAETHSSLHSQSSRLHHLAGALWSVLAYAGHCLLQPGHCVVRSGKVLGCGAVTAFQSLLSLLWMFLTAPAINLTEWRPVSPTSVSTPETPIGQTPATPASQIPSVLPPVALTGADLERLERVEHQLALLWEQLQQRDHKQDERHGNILGLYNTLKEQLHTQTDRESLGLWVSSLLDQRVGVLHGELEQEQTRRVQSEEQQERLQQGQATRLAEIELLLSTLAARTQEVQQRQKLSEQEKQESIKEAASSAAETLPLSLAVKQEDHDALLVEVQRLEAELIKVRQDLQGVISAQVSAQVRKELQTLFFGSSGTGELPESLLHWLSQRYVSTPDLQASLASLEMAILRNVSLQLEQNRATTLGEAESQAKTIFHSVSGAVQHTAAAEGLTEEHVKIIVQNALRLYSQDRTGLVDYALESGGGSILSTRCSETYETKTALMSLFGLPLWYFSQSPRVVIQPDVYPGNCWAFKGSQGYLVIRLSLKIVPTSFCLEHIPKTLSPTGNITSAPRDFTVFGLDDEYQEEGKLLGQYTYQDDGEALQMFPVMEQNDKSFQVIEVRVLSNWGHPDYTCLYRFRVHGDPQLQ
ncbi:SUN domain-containing protein 1 [Takifugu flavidus]|uniref:SUN domain-containing protein 1 n=1 Tax=Takifugu flavidus TaxID=433684 RepID=A0A5C6NT59_9TELE|nr:SUN domain-containing protein 1 [Takifugu flavidus]